MKKVLYITTVSRTINAFLVPHIEMLLDEGYEVDVATCIDKPIDEKLTQRKLKVFNIPFARNPLHPGNLKAFKELIKIQKKEQYDIVHVHNVHSDAVLHAIVLPRRLLFLYTLRYLKPSSPHLKS